MRKLILAFTIFSVKPVVAQNLLVIPDTLSGTNFNLNIYDTSHVFYSSYSTNTFGINADYLGPTLIFNQGDSVNINVNNLLYDTTTIHWHGLHVSSMNDGGPHTTIAPGTIWNPGFKIRDHASSYWYHPHLHMNTNLHATKGAAGMIIVRDTIESALALPRRYGIDDFPLVIQSKCFDNNKQIVIDNASDSVILVNGVYDAYLPTPAQVVRFRVLNASTERVYYLGLENNTTFYQIGSDGGLLNAPLALTRLMLAPGERAEILVDFTGMTGQNIDFMSYASELPNATYGAAQPGMGANQTIPGYSANLLNGNDFIIMTFNIGSPTINPVTLIPATLVANTPYPLSSANANRTLTFSALSMGPNVLQGNFQINNTSFDMNVVNYTIPKDNIEIWTLQNDSPIAHPFHIHDVQFYITEYNGGVPPAHLAGRKDVILVPAMQSVKFITRFDDFCDDRMPYMYHCHMLTHEDDGMMGQFEVSCAVSDIDDEQNMVQTQVFPNPFSDMITIRSQHAKQLCVSDAYGRILFSASGNFKDYLLHLDKFPKGIYLLILAGETGVETIKIIRN